MTGEPLQETIDRDGYMRLREIEEEACASVNFFDTVIATGGSAVYSDAGMTHLKTTGRVIYLDVSLEELLRRIPDMETRGIAMAPGQTFQNLFDERNTLYHQYADIVVDCNQKSVDQALDQLVQLLKI